MKKTYMKPALSATSIGLVSMIAASDPDGVTATISNDEITSGWADGKGRGREIDDDNVKNGWTDGLW